MEAASRFQDKPMDMLQEAEETTDALRASVIFAREYLEEVQISEKQVKYLVEEARRGGVMVRLSCLLDMDDLEIPG